MCVMFLWSEEGACGVSTANAYQPPCLLPPTFFIWVRARFGEELRLRNAYDTQTCYPPEAVVEDEVSYLHVIKWACHRGLPLRARAGHFIDGTKWQTQCDSPVSSMRRIDLAVFRYILIRLL